ncbi:MAG: hypothetical protein UV59_C0012G0037 [Candidatus Gottesmanbacteria bacterium GW2011_GWA1_43_11]|uniref:And RNA helicase protein n=1 Tax=Candidatus Gottesmanbacteria bacterium GW2011_GWA1_43_11 TaxID=1618436 RepID=A0A0G1CHI6_9BACT|nr:MAG: hypothetical protein UV59_C0012G0037 [Candidatus Gottesmanbacteria bacterium GW2011_GWA1_43_11]
MQLIADLQLHSKYSRAVSQEMVIPKMYEWNLKKGIGLLATGDWTHPLWIRELKANLEEQGNGILRLKREIKEHLLKTSGSSEGILKRVQDDKRQLDPLFLLSGEVSCIYTHNGKGRRNHILMFAPSFAVVDRINDELRKRGCNLSSDGRPIIGLSSQEVCEVVWSISEEVLVIPAHAWTPWFSTFGSMSGYDSLAECYGEFSKNIYAIETGLSSNPAMNWRVKELDTQTLISCSDSHSGPKLMREATIYAKPGSDSFTFNDISTALKNWQRDKTKAYIAATLEFYPEEGKYHFDGHRACNVRMHPADTKQKGVICPVCGKPMTIGVMHRVEDLAGRSEQELKLVKKQLGDFPVQAIYSETFPNRAPYIMMVPLQEIIAESMGVQSYSKKVMAEYEKLVAAFGGEFTVLFKTNSSEIARVSNPKIAEGVEKVRKGEITIQPGYDGTFGIVKIWKDEASAPEAEDQKEQLSLL